MMKVDMASCVAAGDAYVTVTPYVTKSLPIIVGCPEKVLVPVLKPNHEGRAEPSDILAQCVTVTPV